MPIIERIVLIKSPYKAVAEEIYEAELLARFPLRKVIVHRVMCNF